MLHKLLKVVLVHPIAEPSDFGNTQSGSDMNGFGFNKQSPIEIYEDTTTGQVLVATKGGIIHRIPASNVRYLRRMDDALVSAHEDAEDSQPLAKKLPLKK